MQTRGAIVRQAPGKYEVVDLEVDDPRPGEIQVKLVATGLCHSDDHVATGDIPVGVYPFAGGHEGAGVVTKAPPNHKGIKEGDHVVFSFLPSCGHCRWCASGQQNLCDLGAGLLAGSRWEDPTDFRLKLAGTDTPVGQMCGISTFVETTTVSASPRFDSSCPTKQVAPSARRASSTRDSFASLPETRIPRASMIRAMPERPAPPIPTKCTWPSRSAGSSTSGTGTFIPTPPAARRPRRSCRRASRRRRAGSASRPRWTSPRAGRDR